MSLRLYTNPILGPLFHFLEEAISTFSRDGNIEELRTLSGDLYPYTESNEYFTLTAIPHYQCINIMADVSRNSEIRESLEQIFMQLGVRVWGTQNELCMEISVLHNNLKYYADMYIKKIERFKNENYVIRRVNENRDERYEDVEFSVKKITGQANN